MATWTKGRGLLGPLAPLMGAWVHEPDRLAGSVPAALRCTRLLEPFGKDWIRLDACWDQGERGQYRETAFTSSRRRDGRGQGPAPLLLHQRRQKVRGSPVRQERRPSRGGGVRIPDAGRPGAGDLLAAGGRRPGESFRFAVESRTQKGWNRFTAAALQTRSRQARLTATFSRSLARRAACPSRLLPHPIGSPGPVIEITVEVARAADGIELCYRAQGRIADVAIPSPVAPMRADGLWKQTCFEAFLDGGRRRLHRVQPPFAFGRMGGIPVHRLSRGRDQRHRRGYRPFE